MNVFVVVPKIPSAIYNIAQDIEKYNPHINIKILPVHPKKADMETQIEAQKLMMWADIIHVKYWRSGTVLRDTFPKEFEAKPKILNHHNPYDLRKEDWKEYKTVLVSNSEQQTILPMAKVVRVGIDLDFFKFNPTYTPEISYPGYTKKKVVLMVVQRIESKKGVREVAEVCNKLGYKFILVGTVSEPDYMRQIIQVGGKELDFRDTISEDELLKAYYEASVLVCNSVDGFETGPLPVIEAMACGVPVLTRPVGIVNDLNNGRNMIVRQGSVGDKKDLEKELKSLVENSAQRDKIRNYGWQTAKRIDARKMARTYDQLYHKVTSDKLLASIIMPICNRGEKIIDVLVAATNQDYPNYELIIADSSDIPLESVVRKIKSSVKVPIKYIRIKKHKDEYTLAKARNEAIIEASGTVLVFCDDRLAMDKNAVSTFVNGYIPKQWLWGIKDNYEKGFVENFSSVGRQELINMGMFCERIDQYGGMTQEVRTRGERNGFNFQRALVNANAVSKSTKKPNKKRNIINMKTRIYKMYDSVDEE